MFTIIKYFLRRIFYKRVSTTITGIDAYEKPPVDRYYKGV